MLLTEAAQTFGIPYNRIYRAVLAGSLPASRANKKSWCVDTDAVAAWLALGAPSTSPSQTTSQESRHRELLLQVALLCRLWGKLGSLRTMAKALQIPTATLQCYVTGRNTSPAELLEHAEKLLASKTSRLNQ